MGSEFGQIEAGFKYLHNDALSAVKPSHLDFDQFKQKLSEGGLVLLNETPTIPALIYRTDALGSITWSFNPQTADVFSDNAKNNFLKRANMRWVAAWYRPIISYQTALERKDTPQPVVKDTQESIVKEYEYCLEVACSSESLDKMVGCAFSLAKTKQEERLCHWEKKPITQVTRYTVQVAIDETKQLQIQAATDTMGLALTYPPTLKKIGTQQASDGFIPIVPAVQFGERLGLPTEGFYYHFFDTKLVQEYKLLGDGKWAFYATRSTDQPELNEERGYNKNQSAILVYWKLAGQIVKNQYLVYLNRQITLAELNNLSDKWLEKNGVKLDIPAILDAITNQPVAELTSSTDVLSQSENKTDIHIVKIDKNEKWRLIADQYGLSPKGLLLLNPQYNADPMSLAVGDKLVLSEQKTHSEQNTTPNFPSKRPDTINRIENSYYQHGEQLLGTSSYKALNAASYVPSDIGIVKLKDATPDLVFAKSCERPPGCTDAGIKEEEIRNFGPWAFFFGQAYANPAAVIPAIEATQAQMAMGNSITMVGGPNNSQNSQSNAIKLDRFAGTLKDKIIEGYLWKVKGISTLFALQQELFSDGTQYTDNDLKQVSTAQSRIRVHISPPIEGKYYPHVNAYHTDDTRIGIKYVKQKNNQLSVVLEENGPTIYWTPSDGGETSWHITPDHNDGFEINDIQVTPIHSGDTPNVTTYPAPEEKDWRDAILVFPENTGISPLYVVYSETPDPNSPSGLEELRKIHGVNDSKLQVEAVLIHKGGVFYDVNQTARNIANATDQHLPIYNEKKALAGKPNNTKATAHAEIGVLGQSHAVGHRGGEAILTIHGKDACNFCQSDLKRMAIQLELERLIVRQPSGDVIFNGPDDFKSTKKGGLRWPK